MRLSGALSESCAGVAEEGGGTLLEEEGLVDFGARAGLMVFFTVGVGVLDWRRRA